jgi:hypothetical protein
MNFPSKLNPLRGTELAWVLPLTWALIKCAMVAAPTTIEVFLHYRFGARSGKALLKGFFLVLIMCLASMNNYKAVIHLFPIFLFGYVIIAIPHWILSQRTINHIYSYSTGEPWSIWRRFPFDPIIVQHYLEPALCSLIGCIVLMFDPSLGRWLLFAAVGLFIKEQVLHAQLRTRRLDSMDSRAESERLALRPRSENQSFLEVREAPLDAEHRSPFARHNRRRN